MLLKNNKIKFLLIILSAYFIFLAFGQNKFTDKPYEPKRKNIYGVKNKIVEVDLEKGFKKFCITYEGREMDLDLKDNAGNRCELIINNLFESYPGDKITEVKNSGKYFLDVKAPGFWHVMIIEN